MSSPCWFCMKAMLIHSTCLDAGLLFALFTLIMRL